jgi:hypothetical protein
MDEALKSQEFMLINSNSGILTHIYLQNASSKTREIKMEYDVQRLIYSDLIDLILCRFAPSKSGHNCMQLWYTHTVAHIFEPCAFVLSGVYDVYKYTSAQAIAKKCVYAKDKLNNLIPLALYMSQLPVQLINSSESENIDLICYMIDSLYPDICLSFSRLNSPPFLYKPELSSFPNSP